MRRRLLLVGVSLCAWVTLAPASTITVSFDSLGMVCEATQPLYTIQRLYLVALLHDDVAASGIQGAEFVVQGFPSGWMRNVTPNPAANAALGDPLNRGGFISFEACQAPGPPGAVVLYTVDYVVQSEASKLVLTVDGVYSQHCNPWCWPILTLCDAPYYTKIIASGGQAALNYPGFCTVSATPRTWSQVKSLYE